MSHVTEKEKKTEIEREREREKGERKREKNRERKRKRKGERKRERKRERKNMDGSLCCLKNIQIIPKEKGGRSLRSTLKKVKRTI